MKSLYLQEILGIIGGKIVSGEINPIIQYVSTGRVMKNSCLFLNKYKEQTVNIQSLKKYKGLVIVSEDPANFEMLGSSATIVKVEDIGQTYWNFVEYYRGLFTIPVIGVTGTCGKTTTKEMIKHILYSKYNVVSTYKSNNEGSRDIYYLTSMDEKTDIGVFEMGVAYPKDLIESCRIYKPQIRVLLNIGVYHLDGCKTPEEYLNAKAKILNGLKEINGTLILNRDDENIKKIDISGIKNIIYFSLNTQADFTAKNITYSSEGMFFILCHEWEEYKVFLPVLGKHNVYNALAAIAAVYKAGFKIEDAIDRLKTFKAVEEHLEIHVGSSGLTVLDDTWSSAPPSVISALDTLSDIGSNKRKIALIGISPLLGEGRYAQEQYSRMGEKVVEVGIDTLIVVGAEAKAIGVRAIELGMKKEDVLFIDDADKIYETILPNLNKDTIILLKITHRQMIEPSFVELKRKLISQNS